MLSEKIQRLTDWVGTCVADEHIRAPLVSQLNALAADAFAIERHIVPEEARRVGPASGGNVADLDAERRRRAPADPPETGGAA